jgi:thiol:disulfide interchange protein DsbD
MASNAIVNLAFFVIFVVFAASFLGAFEITLPSSWVNKADSASEKGGLLGIFFMAFTLSLVSFSCTGPIIGTILVQAAVGGNVINPTIGMIGFSSALALPFGLFAAFPGWLNSLPKSGGWLNSVKVVLGLLELALALKFLSNVDLAYHWGILTREVFIALWIVIFSLLGFYLLGKLKFSHDSDTKYITIPRVMFAIIVFGFVVYLIPGMFGAPLKIISGFPPPTFYNEGWSIGGGSAGVNNVKIIPGTDPEHCPHNLNCFHDYDMALAYAKEVKKPLMVDFTGWSCVNCRKMEDNVWVDPRVLERLNNDYVLVSLYVDDKTALPEAEKRVSKTTGNKIKSIGNKWSDMQTERFGTNSQPYYVLLDAQEQMLNKPTGYDPDIDKFIAFLDEGKKAYSK